MSEFVDWFNGVVVQLVVGSTRVPTFIPRPRTFVGGTAEKDAEKQCRSLQTTVELHDIKVPLHRSVCTENQVYRRKTTMWTDY
jgi:hypothetical protein